MLTHADIWRAIDRLAELNDLSASGLALRAGLNSTSFNISKRTTRGRKRWPSTESIAAILRATDTDLDSFVALAQPSQTLRKTLPLLSLADAEKEECFDEKGYPTSALWEELSLTVTTDPNAFALEVVGKSLEPIYREGDRLVVSPAAPARRGDRVIVKVKSGEIKVRQLLREPSTKVELGALNSSGPALTLLRKDVLWMARIIWASQ